MGPQVASIIVSELLALAEARYRLDVKGIAKAAGLRSDDLKDPSARVPLVAFEQVTRLILRQCGDESFALRCAEDTDLRAQGFWGYALLSSMTLRERLERNIRYMPLRGPVDMTLREEGGLALLDIAVDQLSMDVANPLIELTYASGIYRLRNLMPLTDYDLTFYFTQYEQPRHREFRALAADSTVVFSAPYNRVTFDARALDLPLEIGDPYLAKLVSAQLDAQLAEQCSGDRSPMLDRVRRRIAARLHDDASIDRIARDLGVSVRTLQRMLEAAGSTFNVLSADVRRMRAIAYLTESSDPVEQIAERLGYADVSAFRRAFRRWMGLAPGTFRAAHRHKTRAPNEPTLGTSACDDSDARAPELARAGE